MRIGWRLGILPGKTAEAVDAFGVDVPFLAPALVLVLVPFLQVLRYPWGHPVSANKLVVWCERVYSRQDILVLGLSSLGE